jgi:hypothetical protein
MTLGSGERECGACSMCCRVLEIAELEKPKDKWCTHCKPGQGGCSIYQDRPDVCRNFKCLWLLGKLDDRWQPLKSKMVLWPSKSGEVQILNVSVDARYPDKWRDEPYISHLKKLSIWGVSNKPTTMIYVLARDKRFLILGGKVIDDPPKTGRVVMTSTGEFDFA